MKAGQAAGAAARPCATEPPPRCQPGLPGLIRPFRRLRLANASEMSRVTTSRHPWELVSVVLFREVWGFSKESSPQPDGPVL